MNMGRRTIRGLSFVAVILALGAVHLARAQVRPCGEKQPSSATLPREAINMKVEQSGLNVIPSDLKIDGVVHDAAGVRKRVMRQLNDQVFFDREDWLRDLAESDVREDFEDRGYHEAEIGPIELDQVGIVGRDRRMLVVVHVKEGPQFRVGELKIKSIEGDRDLPISLSRIRRDSRLRSGDLFSEIRTSLVSTHLSWLYSSLTYKWLYPPSGTELRTPRPTRSAAIESCLGSSALRRQCA